MPTTIAEARSLWRELTNERSTTVVADATVDLYLQEGVEALCRRIRYFYITDSSSVTLVSGTQEYSLPTDLMEIKFLEWNGQELVKSSVEEYRRKGIKWRQEAHGFPEEWYIYANKVGFRPTPSAAAVAAAANPVFRYIGRPSAVSGGFSQLDINDWSLPVWFAVYEWSMAHPDSAIALQRAQNFRQMFDSEAELVNAYYALRGLSR